MKFRKMEKKNMDKKFVLLSINVVFPMRGLKFVIWERVKGVVHLQNSMDLCQPA